MQSRAMEIRMLDHDPKLVRTISQWHQQQWGHLSTRTTEDRIAEFAEHGTGVPLTLVGFAGKEPIGTASLLAHDMDIYPELAPWLGSVYVLPEHRRRGIGRQLVAGVANEAARLAVSTLYLFTEDREGFYAAMGWETLRTLPYHGETVTIMKLEFAAGR